jgi:hypothetical protein
VRGRIIDRFSLFLGACIFMPILILIVGAIVGVGVGWLLWGPRGKKPGLQSRSGASAEGYYPFQRSDNVISDQELKLLKQLKWAMGDDTFIFAKVNLFSMVDVPKGTERREFYSTLARSRRVDFLLCDVKDVKPILAIMTGKDDDEVVTHILEAARIPVLKLPAGEVYAPSDLKNKIHFAVRSALDAVHNAVADAHTVEER